MKKLIYIFLLVPCFSILKLEAEEPFDSTWYLSVKGGQNIIDLNWTDAKNSGDAFGGSVGYMFSKYFYMEGEVFYRDNFLKKKKVEKMVNNVVDRKSGKKADVNANTKIVTYEVDKNSKSRLTSMAYMLNLLANFDLGRDWNPYLGLGVGYVHLDYDDSFYKSKLEGLHNTLACQYICGASFPISQKVNLCAEYRYFLQKNNGSEYTVGVLLRKCF